MGSRDLIQAQSFMAWLKKNGHVGKVRRTAKGNDD
jgi:hypothetical protein